LKVEVKTKLKSEVLALVFGMLIILVTFGDSRVYPLVGNLDNIFGPSLWRFMDVLYPLASIMIFLLHGRVKGSLRIHTLTVLIFLVFLMALSMIIIDDIFIVMHHSIELPDNYWVIASWVYPFVSASSFLAFGWLCARLKGRSN
jgi:drug/metabolite transporter (DMT)-like permease